MRVAAWIVGVASLLLQPVAAAPAAMAHPLDPLSNDEIAAVVAVLERAGRVDPATRFALIDLDEPDKAAVLAWRAGESVPRRAAVVARRARRVYEGVVDLGRRRVERWHAVRHVQSRVLGEEWERAQKITKADAQWQAAMRSRGYEPTTAKVFCAPLTAGYFADSTEEGRRLLKVTCFDTTGTRDVWSRPIEGLVAVVDLDANRVVRLLDRGAVPVAPAPEHFEEGAQSAPAPAPATAPGQPRVSIDGNTVSWGRWSFHYRLDARSGLVVSLVRYDDRGRQRLVLYRGSLAEMFVPYMDPDPAWSFRTYFDVGEWGFGTASSLLVPGRDCPADARFLDAVLADAQGHAIEHHQVICVFERNTGAPLLRHAEIANGDYQGRLAVELVVRTIASLGDYDYVIDWVLTEAGAIRIDVGATGIDQVKGVRAQSMADPTARTDSAYGPLVAPHLVGVHHDHFLSFRLDVDIDGPQNTLVRRRLARQRLGGVHSRRSLWRPVDQPVTIEGPLSPDNFHNAVSWRIENPNLRNALGQHPAYELRADTATSLLAPDDFPQRRAAFSASPLWVTAYDPRQLYAAGRYPNQSPGGGGLPTYTAARRSVANTDIVLWYTMGFHHIPRPED
ncbi:MAG TPA: hypothetical protein VLU24_02320, partial [Mycobacterium sp.]|nr:hypothetical protein [Mycobacterium sp.]